MNTQTTLADARAALAELITPDDLTSPRVTMVINEMTQRFTNDGGWKGNIVNITFDESEGFITLPFNFAAALAGTYLRCPFPMFTQFHKYVENGPGNVDETFGWCTGLIDMGDGFVTQKDIATGDAGPLRFYSSAADDTKLVRVFGRDENDQIIYDADGNEGEEVELTAPFVDTIKSYSKVTGMSKQFTKNRVRLFVEPPSVAEYQLAEYQPNETNISYHRYQTGKVPQVEQQANAIRLICRRRHIPVNADTDWVIPGLMSALRNGVQAWLAENASDYENASIAYGRAIGFLNKEAKLDRGGGRPTINVEAFGLGTPIATVC